MNYSDIKKLRSQKTDTDCDTLSKEDSSLDIFKLTKGMKSLDDESYRKFFRAYYHRLWAYLFVFSGGDENMMEDALQLSLTKIVKGIKIFETEEALWAWLAVVTRNSFLDCKRKENRFYRVMNFFQLAEHEHGSNLQQYETHYSEFVLDRALLKLSQHDQQLIQRKYIEGASYRDLANEQGTTIKAIESRLGRIRSKLRQLMQEEIE